MLHRMRLLLGRCLAATPLHTWTTTRDSQGEWLCKRRTRLSGALIRPGNLYLFLQRALSEALDRETWIHWESVVADSLGRTVRVTADRRGLEFPRLNGCGLDDLLRSERSLDDKFRGISLAAAALRQLHLVTTRVGNRGWPLSHGDATARNVIVDLTADAAEWIDFDMRHRLGVDPGTRWSDDVRVLLWSCATLIEMADFPGCIDAVCTGYGDASLIQDVHVSFSGMHCPSVFQLGQTPISAKKLRCLRDALLRRLATRSE